MSNKKTEDDDKPADEKDALKFPSLEDSPLWDDGFKPPKDPLEEEAIPPLFIIRERYPRIAKAIELMWGNPEMNDYFDRIIIDDRGSRDGFPKEVMTALLALSADHRKRFKFTSTKDSDVVWSADPFQKHFYKG